MAAEKPKRPRIRPAHPRAALRFVGTKQGELAADSPVAGIYRERCGGGFRVRKK